MPESAGEETQIRSHAPRQTGRESRCLKTRDANRRASKIVLSAVTGGSANHVDVLACIREMVREITEKLTGGSRIGPKELIQEQYPHLWVAFRRRNHPILDCRATFGNN